MTNKGFLFTKLYMLFPALMLPVLILSCSTVRNTSMPVEEEGGQLVTTRKFAGTFIEYRATVTEDLPKVEVIWIKTSLENRYGKICAVGKKCEFRKDDRLYLTRKHYSPGLVGGRWEYFIENDSTVVYRLTDYQSDKHVLTETWF